MKKFKNIRENSRKVKNETFIEILARKNIFFILSIFIVILSVTVSMLLTNLSINFILYLIDNKLNAQHLDFKTVLGFLWSFKKAYKFFYVLIVALFLFQAIKLVYRIRVNVLSFNKYEKGSSRWTTLEELKQQYKSVPEKTKAYKGNGGVPISRNKNNIFIDDSPVNNLIIGTTRSGKGETFVFPAIDIYSRSHSEDIKQRPSLVVNDPKGELAAASYETLKERGYDIQVLNLTEPERGMGYNPLTLVVEAYKKGDFAKAQMLCNTLTHSLYHDPNAKDPFWSESAKSLVNAIILAITKDCIELGEEEKITMYTVANFLSRYGSEFTDEDSEDCSLDRFFQARESHDIAKMQYATSSFSKGNTRASIFAVAMSKLNIFTFEPLARMTSKSTLNLDRIGFYKEFEEEEDKKPVAIFMVTPDYDSSNHVLASIFVRQIYYVLAQKASISKGQKCEREVIFLLDEFGNMPPIEGMANIITVCLGRGIRFNLIVQAYAQLKKLYGEDDKTIIGNCGNQIYILTNDINTADQFSKLIGNKTIMMSSRSGQGAFALNKSKNQSLDSKGLLNANELMSIKPGETVIQRVIKRQDIKRNSVTPRPIFNTGATKMKHRYEYLADEFDTSKSILDVDFATGTQDVNLQELLYENNIMNLFLNKEPNESIKLKSIAQKRQEKFKKVKNKDEIIEKIENKESVEEKNKCVNENIGMQTDEQDEQQNHNQEEVINIEKPENANKRNINDENKKEEIEKVKIEKENKNSEKKISRLLSEDDFNAIDRKLSEWTDKEIALPNIRGKVENSPNQKDKYKGLQKKILESVRGLTRTLTNEKKNEEKTIKNIRLINYETTIMAAISEQTNNEEWNDFEIKQIKSIVKNEIRKAINTQNI